MKVYVAAKWQDKELVQEVHSNLRKMGHEITCDWTNHDGPDMPEEDMATWAINDINGVRECDLLIVLFLEPRHQRGTLIEIGAALGLGKPVLIVGNEEATSTLLRHPLVFRIKEKDGWQKMMDSK